MGTKLHLCILLAGSVLAKEPELPLCPANYQYLPQNLPMHCRMPVNGHPPPFPVLPGAPGKPQENTQSVPVPPVPALPKPSGFPPGFPAFPPGFAMPPGMMPPGMGMPMQMAGPPQAKLPVIVMPFYSPDPSFKGPAPNLRPGYENQRPHKKKRERMRKRRPQKSDDSDSSDTDTDDSGDEDKEVDDGFWKSGRRTMNAPKRRRHKARRRKEFLTPILQYVTKDGYVIYEKQISKEEAKDWLGKGKANEEENHSHEPEVTTKSVEEEDATPPEVSTRAAPPPPRKVQVKMKKVTDRQRHHLFKPRHQQRTETE